MLHTYKFSLRDSIFSKFSSHEDITNSLFKKHEILNGQTLADLYADNPVVIQKGLHKEMQIRNIMGIRASAKETIVEKLLAKEDADDLKIWKDIKLFD